VTFSLALLLPASPVAGFGPIRAARHREDPISVRRISSLLPKRALHGYTLSETAYIMEDSMKVKFDGRVWQLRDFGIAPERISPDYIYQDEGKTLGTTGRLPVFRLMPRIDRLPSFHARWDGGRRDGKELFAVDIDMRDAPEDEVERFRAKCKGYWGHHTTCITDWTVGPHSYELRVETPSLGNVFLGRCSFTLLRKVGLQLESQGMILNVETHVIRGGG
jgi:hypothetical protein